jgi:VWFA-related protein
MNRILIAVVSVVGALAAVAAQQPTFRTGVDVVVVDVNVVDDQGRPVEGLQASDFSVRVDGKPRRLVSVNFVSDAPVSTSERAARGEAADAPRKPAPLVSSNEAGLGGRLILLMIDQDNIRFGAGRQAIEAARRFIDQLQPSDRVGLLAFPTGPSVELTADHAKVRDELGKVVGREPTVSIGKNIGLSEAFAIDNNNQQALQAAAARECAGLSGRLMESCNGEVETDARMLARTTRQRTDLSLESIRRILVNLRGMDGPKTVVLISESLVTGGTVDALGESASELSQIAAAAAAARVTIFGLRIDRPLVDGSRQAPSPTAPEDQQMRQEGMDSLVSATRGTLFAVTASADAIFSRIALELSGHYLLGFEAEGDDRDSKPHHIDVRTTRPQGHLRSRREFVVPAGDASLTDEAALGRVLASPFPATGIPLRVATFVLRNPQNSQLRLIVAADVDVASDLTEPQRFAVALQVEDAQGKVRGRSFEHASLGPARVPGPLGYEASVGLVPGEYTLRLAVRDRDGRTGSVDHKVDARLVTAAPLQVSDLMLADEDADKSGKWRPCVDARVTNELAAYLELYSADKDALTKTSVRFEVAEDEQAAALLTGEARAVDAAQSGRRTVTGRVGLDLLPPGTYVARALVVEGDRTLGRVVRPFVVSPPANDGTAQRPVAQASPFADLGRRFDVRQVLEPAVLNPFLDRLDAPGAPPLAASVREALARAKQGAFDGSFDKLPASGELAPTFLHGLALLSRGDIEQAANQFRATLRVSSDFFPAAFYLGACYGAGGRDTEAVGAWQTTLAGESDLRVAYVTLFDAFVRLHDWPQALDIGREALEHWPDETALQRRVAAAWWMTGEDEKALSLLRPYVARHSDDHEALFLAMRVMLQSRLRTADGGPRVDAQEFARYAQMYRAANGPRQPLVAVWERYLAPAPHLPPRTPHHAHL